MVRIYFKFKMEDILLFLMFVVFEEFEFFNLFFVIEEDGFLDEYDVYSFIEDFSVKFLINLLVEDFLEEFEIEGKNYFLKIFLGSCGNICGLIMFVLFCVEVYLFFFVKVF